MHQVELSIEREIQFMNKYQLTPDEFFLMKLIFLAQEEHEEYLSMYFTQNQLNNDIRTVLETLQNKGVINKTYKIPPKGTEFNPQDVDFNKRVIEQLYHHSQDLGMELFDAYPAYTNINGKMFSLRNIAKNFKSFDEFAFTYGKSIKFNEQEHKRVLSLLEWAKENGHVTSGICDFVISQQWRTYELLKDGDFGIFNTNELV